MITKYEYSELKKLYNDGYRWIARDSCESIYAYKLEPIKLSFSWKYSKNNMITPCGDEFLLPYVYVKWEDEKPTKILDLMQDYESHQVITGENILNNFFGTDNFNIKYVPQFQDSLSSLKKDVKKEKLYTVKLANGDCLYKFKTIEVGWTNGYSNYENDPDFQLTQSEIESVDPVLMQIAKEVE